MFGYAAFGEVAPAAAPQTGGITTIALNAFAFVVSKGRAAATGALTLTARATANSHASGPLLPLIKLLGRFTSDASSRVSVSAKASLSATATATAKMASSVTGKVGLTARSFADSTMRGSAFVGQLLRASMTVMVSARSAVTGKAPLSARATAMAEASAPLPGRVGLAARAFVDSAMRGRAFVGQLLRASMTIMASGRLGNMTGKVGLQAKATAMAQASSSLNGKVGLLARQTAHAASRAGLFVAQLMSATMTAIAGGRSQVTGKLPLNARVTAAASIAPGLSGAVKLAARAMAAARTQITSAHLVMQLTGLMTAAAKASFGPFSPFRLGLQATATFITSWTAAIFAKANNPLSFLFAQNVTGGEGQKIIGNTLPQNDQSNND